ncbi:conserved hypothetical protein [uncultured Alphaproteobacteria bacterium]|uniref:Xylose isomerase-like TIM barrel domain-containing protein n=1 Tax=uncultured Alphaproteobacteria bacterium TaxID=91750 RepID=A0A212KMQ0_9PROT|nr:conserved hypothetical protein [uncultured Alphaproteobacteria bacterium]
MPRFAANLSTMFTEVPFLERFAAAADAGFDAVEYLLPYAFSPAEVAAPLERHGLTQVLFNLPAGDWGKGERGLAALPGREEEFAAGLRTGLAYARATGCAIVHAMAGIPPAGADPAAVARVYAENLGRAADFFAPHDITVVVEPINHRSMPGFFLHTVAQAAACIERLGRPNLKLQFDFFHVQMEEGCVALKFRENFRHVAHCQLASVPDRHEPDGGELDYGYLFDLVDEIGYAGHIGCEYNPAGTTAAGLGWFAKSRRA